MVHESTHFLKPVRKAREVIDSGVIGGPTWSRYRFTPAMTRERSRAQVGRLTAEPFDREGRPVFGSGALEILASHGLSFTVLALDYGVMDRNALADCDALPIGAARVSEESFIRDGGRLSRGFSAKAARWPGFLITAPRSVVLPKWNIHFAVQLVSGRSTGSRSERIALLAGILEAAVDNIVSWVWTKFIHNCAINAV